MFDSVGSIRLLERPQHIGDLQEHNDIGTLDAALDQTEERSIQTSRVRQLFLRHSLFLAELAQNLTKRHFGPLVACRGEIVSTYRNCKSVEMSLVSTPQTLVSAPR